MDTAVVTDSASALRPSQARDLGVRIVPLTVTVDGATHSDLDLDTDWFYARLAAGAELTTSQSSPGEFLRVYRDLAEHGAGLIWSVHIGSALSGTLNSARLAARSSPIPVRLVDTGTASMPQGLAVRAAALALRDDPMAEVDAVVAGEISGQENRFIILDPARLAASGRAVGLSNEPLPVLSLRSGQPIEVAATASTIEEAIEVIAAAASAHEGDRILVAVGEGGLGRVGDRLESRVLELRPDARVWRYVVPPSVGAHTGSTAGLVISSRHPA